ncbi:MAG: preprotein translocase subunit SecE [Candidatus Shapirobacteria bacterium]|jgi:preprotein translocase SecE subunit
MQKIRQFINEVRTEFKNITWPKKDALIQLTFVVISISIAISLILGGFDFLFTNAIGYLTTGQNKQNTTNQPSLQEAVSSPSAAMVTITITEPTVIPSTTK